MAEANAPLPKPDDWDSLFPGRFLHAADLKGKNVTLTIAAVDLEKLPSQRGEKTKGILSFEKTDKQFRWKRPFRASPWMINQPFN